MVSSHSLNGRVLVVAGEASGDQHAAGLLAALHEQAPRLEFFGMGGRHLRAAGMESLQEIGALSVMGFAEVMGSAWRLLAAYRRLRSVLARQRPRAVLLVDFPDFNLPLARVAFRLGIPAIYFISPQVWAWRQARVKTLVRHVRRVICILPFEADLYQREGGRAVYVGHPLIDQAGQALAADQARHRLAVDGPGGTVLALLPGSRRQEIRSLLPEMVQAVRRLRDRFPLRAVLVPVAPTLAREEVVSLAGGALEDSGVQLVSDAFFEVLAVADVALVASGTSTLAAAVMGTPMVLGYRVHPVTYAISRRLAQVDHVGLVNLVAGRRIVAELVQGDFTAENLAREASRLLVEGPARSLQKEAYRRVRSCMGPPGVFQRAARQVVDVLEEDSAPAG